MPLLIMAIPNDIIQDVDLCEFVKEIWDELGRLLEDGLKVIKNLRTKCQNDYETFKAKLRETLMMVYQRSDGSSKRHSLCQLRWRMTSLIIECDHERKEMAKAIALLAKKFERKFGRATFSRRVQFGIKHFLHI
ncbi:hypothetical protein L1987_13651 [Smallanthus sonchifolius]|uniref:Uncharacterized protein n=1 Tax=Smallanthus sonchifolius TaxID=185202 RepID=A0ACB9JHY5_9ASTR|nr:hypothetical protein L1987_13651 [Smallanthus sonchifolius]